MSPFLRRLRALSCLCAATVLASCGFRLQGAVDLPVELRRVYVATADELTPFAVELREALHRNGATLAPAAGVADAVVRVREDRTGRRVLSVSARNTPREYEIFYAVTFSLQAGTESLIEPEQLVVTRSYTYDETQVLGKAREERILRRSLADDLARRVLRRQPIQRRPPAPVRRTRTRGR